MAVKIGKYTFKRIPRNGGEYVANDGRLVVRKSVACMGMWCASARVGGDDPYCMRREDGNIRRFRKKETAMAALVKFWDSL